MRPVDGRRHQDAVTSQLHGEGRVGRGADTDVEDDRDVDGVAEQGDVVRVADAQPAADR